MRKTHWLGWPAGHLSVFTYPVRPVWALQLSDARSGCRDIDCQSSVWFKCFVLRNALPLGRVNLVGTVQDCFPYNWPPLEPEATQQQNKEHATPLEEKEKKFQQEQRKSWLLWDLPGQTVLTANYLMNTFFLNAAKTSIEHSHFYAFCVDMRVEGCCV